MKIKYKNGKLIKKYIAASKRLEKNNLKSYIEIENKQAWIKIPGFDISTAIRIGITDADDMKFSINLNNLKNYIENEKEGSISLEYITDVSYTFSYPATEDIVIIDASELKTMIDGISKVGEDIKNNNNVNGYMLTLDANGEMKIITTDMMMFIRCSIAYNYAANNERRFFINKEVWKIYEEIRKIDKTVHYNIWINNETSETWMADDDEILYVHNEVTKMPNWDGIIPSNFSVEGMINRHVLLDMLNKVDVSIDDVDHGVSLTFHDGILHIGDELQMKYEHHSSSERNQVRRYNRNKLRILLESFQENVIYFGVNDANYPTVLYFKDCIFDGGIMGIRL